MTRFVAPLWALAFMLPAPAFAQEAIPSAAESDEVAELQRTLDRGEKLYRYDQAAWHTTDALMEDIPDPGAAGVRGWVVTEFEAGHLVTYWKPSGDSFEAVYSATYDGSRVAGRTIHGDDDSALSTEQITLIRAGKVPDPGKLRRCSRQPFNTVIMPSGKASGSTYVYYLVPQPGLSEVPMGGHFRFEVLDGEVIGERKFTNSCISLATGSEDSDKKPVGLAISHSLDPIPTEIHVFSTYVAKIPIFVIITEPDRLWSVEIADGKPSARIVER